MRDIAAHILDGDLRKLSAYRDGFVPRPDRDISTFEGLTAFLNDLNATWTRAARRLSPQVLIELLSVSGPAVASLLSALPPDGISLFAVSWAGESRSENWLDVGREYTERWHHQMQIRIAVGADPLLQRRWAHPVFDLSMRALPRAWAGVSAADGAAVTVEVRGEGGGAWTIVSQEERWQLWRGAAPSPAAVIRIDDDLAWRSLFNAVTLDEARSRAEVRGDEELATPFFRARAVMV